MSTPERSVPDAGITHKRLIVALSTACAVLLVTTVAFGAAALWLSSESAAGVFPQPTATTPTPTSDPSAESESQLVQGFGVTTVSDLTFGEFALTRTDEQGFTVLFATIDNDDADQATEVYFDISAYGPDGDVVGRTPSSVYLLPGQQSLFQGIIASDMTTVDRIKIEQTIIDREPSAVTGAVQMDSVRGDDEGLVEGTFSSTLSGVSEYTDIFIAGYVDGEMFAVCSDLLDVPAEGETFTVRCQLEPASRTTPKPITQIPEDAVFDAFLAAPIPF